AGQGRVVPIEGDNGGAAVCREVGVVVDDGVAAKDAVGVHSAVELNAGGGSVGDEVEGCAGATLNFVTDASTARVQLDGAVNTNGILGGYAVINNYADFATYSGTAVVPFNGYNPTLAS